MTHLAAGGKIEKYTRPPLDCNVTPMKTTSLATQHILIAAPSAVMFLENANYFFFAEIISRIDVCNPF